MAFLESKTSTRILSCLFNETIREFKESELISLAGTGKGSASKLIDNLAKEGLLNLRRVGKTKLISINLRNSQSFLLKMLFDHDKLKNLSKQQLSLVLFFKSEAKDYLDLMIVFGSTISGKAKESSDIDLLIVTKDIKEIELIRRKTEDLFNQRINLHIYDKLELFQKVKNESLISNALLKGIVLFGYDFAQSLLSSLKEKNNIENLLLFNERVKAAVRNISHKDYSAAEAIIKQLLDQIVFSLADEKGLSYSNRRDVYEAIRNISEYKIIQKINKVSLKHKIKFIEDLVLGMLIDKILKNEH